MKATMQEKPRGSENSPSAQKIDYVVPEVNIFETKDGYVLEAEMPGVSKEGLEITLEGNELTITGRRHLEKIPGEGYRFTEIHLMPEIGVFPEDLEKARRSLAKAEKSCFISNSVRATVHVEPVFVPVALEVAHH